MLLLLAALEYMDRTVKKAVELRRHLGSIALLTNPGFKNYLSRQ